MCSWCRSPPLRSTLTLTVILTLLSRLHPHRPHPHPRPHRPMARAVGPRLTWRAALTLALAPGGRRPRGRGRSTRRVLPRVEAARPHAGSALRRVTLATGRLRGPRAGTERESVDATQRGASTTGCAGVLDATPHTRGRVPARHAPSAVGDAHDAPCCAVWQVRAAAAPWRAPPGGLGAQPRRARGLDIVRRAAVRRRLGSSRSSWCSSSAPPRSPTPRSTAARCPRSRRSCWRAPAAAPAPPPWTQRTMRWANGV